MSSKFIHSLAFLLLFSGTIVKESLSISTKQRDVTTPMTTTPTITTTSTNPTVMNPANPVMTPLSTNSPYSSTGSWCIASKSVSLNELQIALDYACGHGGTDCSAIQPGGNCFNPITVRDHASYAFNSYYQKNPIPTSCNFGGSAVTTSTNPSYGTCQYPSTSTSSSLLNITNSIGARVFGAGRPVVPSTSAASKPISSLSYLQYIISFFSLVLFL